VVDDLDRMLVAGGHGAAVAIGVGAPGLVTSSGVLRFAPNIAGDAELAVAEQMGALTGRPVAVDNDATFATLAEWQRGAGRGSDNLVMVTLGTGIGAGLVVGGRIQRGANGFAGELGHVVIDPNGPPCPCGRRGCWERYASGSGMGRLARDAAESGRAERVLALAGGDPEAVRGEHVAVALTEADPGAVALVDEFAWWVALGLANLVATLDSDRLIIGGGLATLGSALVEPVRRHFATLVLGAGHRPEVQIVLAELGPSAGAIGAATAAAGMVGGA
jgi:glucokinase